MNVYQPRSLHVAETVCAHAQAVHDHGHHDAYAGAANVPSPHWTQHKRLESVKAETSDVSPCDR
jgi:hypothetical protein